MNLKLYMTSPSTEVLGPHKRYVLWVQGCNKRCKGCISPDSWDINGGYEQDIQELAEEIINTPGIEGITISGGEPFLQQTALYEMISKVREHKDVGVIIYTGMKYSEIENTALAHSADLIIDGEYVEELNDNKSLRGSSNQNVICLTKRYEKIVSQHYGIQGRKIELILLNGESRLIGIPSKNFERIIGG